MQPTTLESGTQTVQIETVTLGTETVNWNMGYVHTENEKEPRVKQLGLRVTRTYLDREVNYFSSNFLTT